MRSRIYRSDQVNRERMVWGLRMLSGVPVKVKAMERKTALLQTIRQLREQGLLRVEKTRASEIDRFGDSFCR